MAKAPLRNPFGEDEEPIPFNTLDIYTRIRVLHQLSTWTLGNVDRIRGLMPEDEDHLSWRMEPLGWDKEDRSYYVLDDNRLYRRTDEKVAPLTPVQKPKAKPKSKAKAKAKSKSKPMPPRTRGTRSSKRQKVEESEEEEVEEQPEGDDTAMDDTVMTNAEETKAEDDGEEEGYGFTGKTWELIAITLDEYQEFMASIFRSRDPNEKLLRARLEEDVLPIIEKRAEAIRQKQLKKLRELENVQKMATAKRSSRLAGKAEKEAQEREEREAEEKKQADLRMAREEQARQLRIEEVRDCVGWAYVRQLTVTRATNRADSLGSSVSASGRQSASCTKRSLHGWKMILSVLFHRVPRAMRRQMLSASPSVNA